MFKLLLHFLLLHLTNIVSGRIIFPITENVNENDQCISHTGVQGKCVLINLCPSLSKCLLTIEHCPKICSWERLNPIICCPLNTTINSPDESSTITTETDETITSEITTENESTIGKSKDKINCGVKLSVSVIAVVGGDEVRTPYDWPWIAALFTKTIIGRSSSSSLSSSSFEKYNHFCGGTIIAENCILTAAHCLNQFKGNKVSDLFVGIGSNDLTETIKLPIKKIIVHPNYVATKSYYDIALLITSTPIKFTDTIRPICLPGHSVDNSIKDGNLSDSNPIEVAGWGRQSYEGPTSPRLREADLKIVPNQQCNQLYSHLNSSSIPKGIKSDQLCAGTEEGDKDSCQGDSGGPLTMKVLPSYDSYDEVVHYQIGIVSFGRGCADPNYPGVYTRISNYIPWIEEQLKFQT